MAKNNTSKILVGTVAGIALGVAASMFLTTKKGKEVKKTIESTMADFYKYISPKVKKIEKMGEKEYKEFMKTAAMQYSKTKKMSDAMTKELIKESQQSWKHFSRHLGK